MKTITLIIIVLFSSSFIQAQENTFPTKRTVDIKKTQNSKADFYKELITTHSLQITITDNNPTTVTRTKAEFYNELISKNNLKPTTALAYTHTQTATTYTYTINTVTAISLVP